MTFRKEKLKRWPPARFPAIAASVTMTHRAMDPSRPLKPAGVPDTTGRPFTCCRLWGGGCMDHPPDSRLNKAWWNVEARSTPQTRCRDFKPFLIRSGLCVRVCYPAEGDCCHQGISFLRKGWAWLQQRFIRQGHILPLLLRLAPWFWRSPSWRWWEVSAVTWESMSIKWWWTMGFDVFLSEPALISSIVWSSSGVCGMNVRLIRISRTFYCARFAWSRGSSGSSHVLILTCSCDLTLWCAVCRHWGVEEAVCQKCIWCNHKMVLKCHQALRICVCFGSVNHEDGNVSACGISRLPVSTQLQLGTFDFSKPKRLHCDSRNRTRIRIVDPFGRRRQLKEDSLKAI